MPLCADVCGLHPPVMWSWSDLIAINLPTHSYCPTVVTVIISPTSVGIG